MLVHQSRQHRVTYILLFLMLRERERERERDMHSIQSFETRKILAKNIFASKIKVCEKQ